MALKDLLISINPRVNRGPIDDVERATDGLRQSADRAGRSFDKLTERINKLNERVNRLGSTLQSAGADFAAPFLAGGAAITAGLGSAVNAAMDFEAQMSNIKSVMSPEQVAKYSGTLEKLAIQMGKETKFSALEAAQGIEELVKAGVKVEDIVNGGLEGALSLAVAGNLDLAAAAEIASTALNAFKKDNLTVSKAADILAGAANASATSVDELRYGLSQVSVVADNLGLSFFDTSAALALFANNGLKGSDAGTSLKTMLSNLIPQSKEAREMMMDLGIITKDGANAFFDAQGRIRSMAEIAGVLQNALKGLNAEQRQQALYTMFGSDAIRAANILYKEGTEGLNAMQREMSKVTAAQVAATRMDNLRGSIEQLKGAAETAGITMGNYLIPPIRKAVDAANDLIDKFNEMSPAQQKLVTYALAISSAIMLLLGGFGLMVVFIGTVVQSFGAFLTIFKPVVWMATKAAIGFSRLRASIAGMTAAVRALWPSIRLFAPMILTLIRMRLASAAVTALGFAFHMLGGPIGVAITAISLLASYIVKLYRTNETFRNAVNNAWNSIQNTISSAISAIIRWFGDLEGKFGAVVDYFKNSFAGIGNTIATLSPLIARLGLSFLGVTGPVGWVIAAVISLGSFLFKLINNNEQAKASIISGWQSIQKAFQPVLNLLSVIGQTFVTMLSPAIAEFARAFAVLAPEFQKTGQIIANSFAQLGPSFAQLGAAFAELQIAGGQLFSTLASTLIPLFVQAATTILPMLSDLFVTVIQLVTTLATSILPLLAQVFQTVFTTVLSVLQMVIPFAVQLLSSIIPIIIQLATMIIPLILQAVQMVFPMILTIIQMVLPVAINLFRVVISVILQIAQIVLPLILQVAQMVFPMILSIIQAAIPVVTAILTLAARIITTILVPAIQVILQVVQFVFPLVMTIIQTAITIVTGIIKTASAIMRGDWSAAWEAIQNTARTIMNNIISFFKSIDLFDIGKNIIQGLINGIGSMVGAVVDKVRSVASSVKNTFTKLLGIHSPSVVFEGYGINTGEGFNIGLERMMDSTIKTVDAFARTVMRPFEPVVEFAPVMQPFEPFDPIAGFSPMATPAPVSNNNVQGDTYNIDVELTVHVSGDASEEDGKRIGTSIVEQLEEFFGSLNRRMPTPQEL